MKKILLINPPGKTRYLRDQYCSSSAKASYYWPAIDLLVLSGILGSSYEVEVLDCIAQKASSTESLAKITRNKYDAVVSLSSTASKDEDFRFFEDVKKSMDCRLIVNAGFLRTEPANFLKEYHFLDAILLDYTASGVVEYLKSDLGLGQTFSGLSYRNALGQVIAESGSSGSEQYFSYNLPRHELFPLNKYRLPQARFTPFTCAIISRGCPFKCAFCASSSIPYRLRSRDNIYAEFSQISRLKIREIHFPDFTFTANREHALKVCRMMKTEKLNFSWGCLTRPDCFDEELAKAMKDAGCHTIQFGVETKNEQILARLARPLSNASTRKAFELCRSFGIDTIAFFIIGLPQDEEKSVRETMRFARELSPDYAAFSVFVPDYGSPHRRILEKEKPELVGRFNFDRTKFPVLENGILSRKKIWQLRNKAIADFYFRPEYMLKHILKLNSLHRVKVAFRIFFSLFKGAINGARG